MGSILGTLDHVLSSKRTGGFSSIEKSNIFIIISRIHIKKTQRLLKNKKLNSYMLTSKTVPKNKPIANLAEKCITMQKAY